VTSPARSGINPAYSGINLEACGAFRASWSFLIKAREGSG